MTAEQQNREQVASVMKTLKLGSIEEMDKLNEADDKVELLDRVSMLRDTLIDEDVNIESIPVVDQSSSTDQIKQVYKMLQLKNNRIRYRGFAEEMILAGAYGLEMFFDGTRDVFGSKPDLTGWSDTVRVRLRRMQYETSSLVQEIMSEYNMSSTSRMFLELLPSMFMYSRAKKNKKSEAAVSESHYRAALNAMNASG